MCTSPWRGGTFGTLTPQTEAPTLSLGPIIRLILPCTASKTPPLFNKYMYSVLVIVH